MHQSQHVLKVGLLVTIGGTPLDVFIRLGFATVKKIAMMDRTRRTVRLQLLRTTMITTILLRTTMITTIMLMVEHGSRLMELLQLI